MCPRPMMAMPGMPYHMGMSMSMSSIPSAAPTPSMGIKASPAALQLNIHRPAEHMRPAWVVKAEGTALARHTEAVGHHVPLCIEGL